MAKVENLVNAVIGNAVGLPAADDDALLVSVQAWLLGIGRLNRVTVTAPCELTACHCAEQMRAESSEWRGGRVECVRMSEQVRATGTVKFFDVHREYGFVVPDDGGKDIFLHRHSVRSMPVASLEPGARVSFTTEACKHGLRVVDIIPAEAKGDSKCTPTSLPVRAPSRAPSPTRATPRPPVPLDSSQPEV